MKPTVFEGQNCMYGGDSYFDLPAHKAEDGLYNTVTTCWKLSFKERLKVLFTGLMWVQLLTFNKPLSPTKLSVDKPNLTGASS